jgi:hypothetical protein
VRCEVFVSYEPSNNVAAYGRDTHKKKDNETTTSELIISCIPGICAGIVSGLFGGWWLAPWCQHRFAIKRERITARAAFVNYIDPIINGIQTENAPLMAVPSTYAKWLNHAEIEKRMAAVRPHITDKGVFDSTWNACKNTGFGGYGDAQNEKAKQDVLKYLRRLRELSE